MEFAQLLSELKNAQDTIAKSTTSDEGVWQYEQAPGVWHSLDTPTTATMEDAYKEHCQAPTGTRRKVTLRSTHHSRDIDFARMEQRNLQTGKVRRIRRSDSQDLEPKLQSERLLLAKAKQAELATEKVAPILETVLAKVQQMKADMDVLTKDRNAALQKVHDMETAAGSQAAEHEAALARAAEKSEKDLRRQRESLLKELEEKTAGPESRASWTCRSCGEPNNAKRTACNNCGDAPFAKETSQLINKFREAVEMWRDPKMRDILGPMHSIEDPTLCKKMEAILRCTSHSGADSECDPMSRAVVTKVLTVLNPSLWEGYCKKKDGIKQAIHNGGAVITPGSTACRRPTRRTLGRCSVPICDLLAGRGVAARPTRPAAAAAAAVITPLRRSQATRHMQKACSERLYWAELDEGVNEIWAWHGTTNRNAESIAQSGVDPKRCVNGFYGRGFYAAQEACKSLQYTDAGKFSPAKSEEGCMVLCRIVLGEADYAETPDHSKTCPRGACHSVAANPGKEGGPSEQQHQEFVIFDPKQVYPDFIVFFKMTPAPVQEAPPAATSAQPSPAPAPAQQFAHFFGFGNSDDDYDDGDLYDCGDRDGGGSYAASFGDHDDYYEHEDHGSVFGDYGDYADYDDI